MAPGQPTLFVVLSADFSNAPTINSTTYHFACNPGNTMTLGVGAAVAVWVASESSTVAWNAIEVQF